MANTVTVPQNGLMEIEGVWYAVRVDQIDFSQERLSGSGKNYTLATGKVELGTVDIDGVSKKVVSLGTVYRFK